MVVQNLVRLELNKKDTISGKCHSRQIRRANSGTLYCCGFGAKSFRQPAISPKSTKSISIMGREVW
jgi:hypothetical protein